MSTSELHCRLEHLVSYSSQLIFVSNDKISQQSKIVEAFLGEQSENTEVAIIDAKQTTFLQDYRNQLFTQLIGGSATADFERPLNQLLSSLNEYAGPILIIVSHAENLPQKLLQELWELVLQSRFAANKQHLNVLLFAHSEWAEQARTWLPTSSENKPIQLNSGNFMPANGLQVGQIEQTDLEQLICAKREQFAERIRDRGPRYEAVQPVLRKPWLASLMILLFVGVFGGMLYWQYPEVANNWWKLIGTTFDTPTETSTSEQKGIPRSNTDDSAQLSGIAKFQDVQDSNNLDGSVLQQSLVEETAPVVPDRLITEWKNVVEQIDTATTTRRTQSGTGQLHMTPDDADASLAEKNVVLQADTNVDKAPVLGLNRNLAPGK